MEQKKEIQSLLKKYIQNECSPEEIKEVIRFFQKNQSFSEFPESDEILDWIEVKQELSEKNSERIFDNILSIAKEKDYKPPRSFYRRMGVWKYVAAAVFVGVLCLNFFFENPFASISVENTIGVDEQFVTLQLEDGSVKVIKESGNIRLNDENGKLFGSQKGSQLIYSADSDSPDLKYNTLSVPYGKKFQVRLSDGSFVHLNSGTSLRYPVKFAKGSNREVFLQGEAFFDVAKDKKHPFIVNTDKMDVQVLGTRFNVSSYEEDASSDVVLVEGSVAMYPEGGNMGSSNNLLLKPGFKGQFNKSESSLSQKRVLTSIYTSWINGELVFRNMEFGNILKKLERHYNISIENKNEVFEKETFNASFGNQPIDKVLENMKTMYGIEYTITGNKVIIK